MTKREAWIRVSVSARVPAKGQPRTWCGQAMMAKGQVFSCSLRRLRLMIIGHALDPVAATQSPFALCFVPYLLGRVASVEVMNANIK